MPEYKKITVLRQFKSQIPKGGVDLEKNLNKIFIPTELAAHLVSFTVYSLLLIAPSSEFHQKKIRSS